MQRENLDKWDEEVFNKKFVDVLQDYVKEIDKEEIEKTQVSLTGSLNT